MSLRNKRKHVMNEAQWEDQRLPLRNQYIVKVLRSMGNNLHMVKKPCGEVHYVSMPTKFRRSIWIKRGNYVLVEPILEGKKVKAEIVKIFNKDSIKFYKENNIWPEEFVENKILEVKDDDIDFFENLNRNYHIQYCSEDSSDSGRGTEVED
ncbi:probable RNA-binding protein EIF1AD [Choristoneura fumiferana]|uniref:probable RNA-binding protein EIF1AD n=1 Tax=Choristoneura fumiferana TaxID=7141 RepID=UPI003D15B729